MSDWREISKEAAFVSHRLIGWIYWDPDAINAYTCLLYTSDAADE